MIKQILQKALLMSAFFVSVVLPLQAADACVSSLKKEEVSVRYVYDGDTLQLSDRRRVRLVGFNAPELKEGPDWSRSVAKKGKFFLQKWLSSKQNLYLQIERDPRDNYGRVLGYIVDENGMDPGVLLLEKGLGYAVVIAPNLEKQRCYFDAEKRAQLAGVGIWANAAVIQAKNVNKKQTGFMLVQGRVTRHFRFKTSEAIVLDDNLVVMIKGVLPLPLLSGDMVRVRGWVQSKQFTRDDFSAFFMVHLNHVANIEML